MIDERAIVHPSAKVHPSVHIGPFSIIGAGVELGEDTWIGPHVVLQGPTVIGRACKIYQFASVGEAPQDKKYQGEESRLVMGDNNIIREYVSIQRGTTGGGGLTSIGHDNLFMAYVHIAHDCVVGNEIIFANNASLAGHVIVQDKANLGGFVGVRQFCTIGQEAFLTGASVVVKDVLPYTLVQGYPAKTHGLNSVGLERRGHSAATQDALKAAYKIIFRMGNTVDEALEALSESRLEHPEVERMCALLKASTLGVTR